MRNELLVVLSAALGLLVGCVSSSDSTEFETVQCAAIRGSQVYSVDPSNNVCAAVSVDILLPEEKSLRDFAECNIALCWKYAIWDDAKEVSGYKDAINVFLEEFRENKKEVQEAVDNGEELSPSIGWDFSLSSEITWQSEKYFSFRSELFAYFGGVHPDCWYRNGTYSYQHGRPLRISDLFDKSALLPVVKLIRAHIGADETRSDYLRERMTNSLDVATYEEYAGKVDEDGRPVPEEGYLPSQAPCVTENFMIVQEGIVWTYNEYEISSYTEGHTDVFVPWSELAPYLKSQDLMESPKIKGAFEKALDDARDEGETFKIGNLEFF